MTDFDKLAELLGMTEEFKKRAFENLVNKNAQLYLWFNEDGSLDWSYKD